jgi:acyl-CoA synthetase (AMP-forming)/AMP-acid ligase II/thioesterase domain-containing protein/SAM-dependent methyltransferase/acyl carrier protein
MNRATPAREGTASPAPVVEDTLVSAFGATVLRQPDAPAVDCDGVVWSYTELDRRSNGVANQILALPPERRTRVALPGGIDAPYLAELLGALKAGVAAVPLDRSWPAARMASLLECAGASRAPINHDQQDNAVTEGRPLSSNQPALVYFTSGTTGEPKQAVVTHRNALFMYRRYIDALDLAPGDRMAWLTSPGFGASASIVLGTLLAGGCLVPCDIRRKAGVVPEFFRRERVTAVHLVPSLFRNLAPAWTPADVATLRVVKLGGEPALASDLALFKEKCPPGCVLVNGLGITEAGGNVTYFRADRETALATPTVPIGAPVRGIDIRICGDDGRDAVEGRLVLRSRFIATGTIVGDERELVSEDYARWTQDGLLVHTGRVEDRVKVNGHTVNLCEVDAALCALPGVHDAIAAVRHGESGAELVACCVAELPGSQVRAGLAASWPAYMIPTRVIVRDTLPRLPGGKADRTAVVQWVGAASGIDDAPPRNAVESQLQQMWQRTLRVDHVGIRADFFDSGGTSLAAAELAGAIERLYGVWLPLSAFHEAPTIESQAMLLHARHATAESKVAILLQRGGEAPPLFCVPGAGSDALALRDLARALPPSRSFYAFQYPGLNGQAQRHRSLGELAGHFADALCAVYPVGPCLLAGTSSGGRVAAEMARQLRERGRHVPFVGLLDTYGPGYPRVRRDLGLRRRALLALRSILPLGRKDELNAGSIVDGVHELARRLLARWRMRDGRSAVPPLSDQFLYLQEVCFRATAEHGCRPVEGPLHLFRAAEGLPEILYEPDPTLGWSGVAGEGLAVTIVPGRHGYHIREPNAAALATKLEDAIGRAIDGAGSLDMPHLLERSRRCWEELADWWDGAVGDEGNPRTAPLLAPAVEALLGMHPGWNIVDAGCGNGWFSRRLARAGARVFAFDFSARLIAHARKRNGPADNPRFDVLDAADEDHLARLETDAYDAAVCTMALHDMAVIEPLIRRLALAVKVGGRFVFSMPLSAGAGPRTVTALGIAGQPIAHLNVVRPLEGILGVGERYGWKLERQNVVNVQGAQGLAPAPIAMVALVLQSRHRPGLTALRLRGE